MDPEHQAAINRTVENVAAILERQRINSEEAAIRGGFDIERDRMTAQFLAEYPGADPETVNALVEAQLREAHEAQGTVIPTRTTEEIWDELGGRPVQLPERPLPPIG